MNVTAYKLKYFEPLVHWLEVQLVAILKPVPFNEIGQAW